jgi:hypothetical protein
MSRKKSPPGHIVKHVSPKHKALISGSKVAPELFNNFLISGSGRSGTRFLANLMDRSELWSVKHEPGLPGIENYTSADSVWQTYKRFEWDGDHYGEVNSMLRRIFIHMPVRKKGLLIRNPYDIYLSIANRKQNTERQFLDEFVESLKIITHALRKDKSIKVIDFEKITTDVDYAQSILRHFSIIDVEVTDKDVITKVNYTKEENKKYKAIKDLPPEVRKEVIIESEKFLEND